jgi:Domain of unknown function (DUF1833).
VLLELSHPDWPEPIYAVNNLENVTSNGTTYTAFPFRVQLPNLDEREPRAKLQISNVSREIGKAAWQVTSPIDVQLDIVFASDPDTVLMSVPRLQLRGVTLNNTAVEGELTLDELGSEPAGLLAFNSDSFPGLFTNA